MSLLFLPKIKWNNYNEKYNIISPNYDFIKTMEIPYYYSCLEPSPDYQKIFSDPKFIDKLKYEYWLRHYNK